jgi:hypothetical protein
MAKVSMHLGFTFRVGDLTLNQYGRIDLNVDQIDTELPIDEQLAEVGVTTDNVWKYLKNKIDSQMEEVLDESE